MTLTKFRVQSGSVKIVFDARYLDLPSGGVRRETENLLNALHKVSEPMVYISKNQNLKNNFGIGTQFRSRLTRRQSNVYTLLTGRPERISLDSNLVLPGVSNLNLPKSSNSRTMVRLHDVFPITNPNWFHGYQAHLFEKNLNNLQKNGAIFFCDSHFSKNSLDTLYKGKVLSLVVPCYIAELSSNQCLRCTGCSYTKLKKTYFLSVGTIEPRKDYLFLMKSLEFVKDQSIDFVVVGKMGWKSKSTKKKMNESKAIKHLNDCCDGSLKELYKNARGFIRTSNQEGFNLPAMEARKIGIPLILRSNFVHKELHMTAAYFFESETDLAEILNSSHISVGKTFGVPKECQDPNALSGAITRNISKNFL